MKPGRDDGPLPGVFIFTLSCAVLLVIGIIVTVPKKPPTHSAPHLTTASSSPAGVLSLPPSGGGSHRNDPSFHADEEARNPSAAANLKEDLAIVTDKIHRLDLLLQERVNRKEALQRQKHATSSSVSVNGAGTNEEHHRVVWDRNLAHIPVERSPLNVGEKIAGGIGLTDTIFVSIASYRDAQCAPTIFDMFRTAKRPEALFLGVVQQNFPSDPPCMPKEFLECQSLPSFCPSDHIQVRQVLPNKAKGPTFGRYYSFLMYRGETYIFMMDSHNRFVTHWDAIIVQMYKSIDAPKPVLSHYPEMWSNPEDDSKITNPPLDNRQTTTYLCAAKFIPEGFPRLDGIVLHRSAKPRPQPWAAAGFLFADGKIVSEVPFDPHLPFIFDGEEILYSVRMWTHGWDIFSPNQNIMYHYYYRKKASKFWSLLPATWTQDRDASLRRIQYLLQVRRKGSTDRVVPENTTEEAVLKELDKYGLGKERSLEEYYKWAQIDPVQHTITTWCGKY